MNERAFQFDYSRWLPDAEVCARLGVSIPTLDRYAKTGRLHPAHDKNRRRGNRPIRVWDPDEVDAQMPAPPTRPLVPVPSATSAPIAPREQQQSLVRTEDTDRVIARLVEMVVEERSPKMWVSLEEAANRTGLSRGLLYHMVVTGALDGLRDRGDNRRIKVRSEDLEDLDVAQELIRAPKGKRG